LSLSYQERISFTFGVSCMGFALSWRPVRWPAI